MPSPENDQDDLLHSFHNGQLLVPMIDGRVAASEESVCLQDLAPAGNCSQSWTWLLPAQVSGLGIQHSLCALPATVLET